MTANTSISRGKYHFMSMSRVSEERLCGYKLYCDQVCARSFIICFEVEVAAPV
jgi:hypothetical protein